MRPAAALFLVLLFGSGLHSENFSYWFQPEGGEPGAFLAQEPAATGVTVTCDRWPDASDLRQFGLDAIRLSGARTDQEKCIAVWRWLRRFTMHTDGNAPTEPFSACAKKDGYIDDPLKVLNVYGAHYCDGLCRSMEAIWRALGYRAEKLYRRGHTLTHCYYRDTDGVERWHLFDLNHGGYCYHSSGERLLGADEMATDIYLWMADWTYCRHMAFPKHQMALSFREGESLERLWGNGEKPYLNNVGYKLQNNLRAERGPYAEDYGNGQWIYAPDLSSSQWTRGLAEPPVNVNAGGLYPAVSGKPGRAVWHFRSPYVISDAQVKLNYRRNAGDEISLHLSVDNGATWRKVWEAPVEKTGAQEDSFNVCDKFPVLGKGGAPAQRQSPYGRYAYRLMVELQAQSSPAECRVGAIAFTHSVQQNFYALPQLQPGVNQITVKGSLQPGKALEVTYCWSDADGIHQNKNVTVIEKLPFTYPIVVSGNRWEDCVCRSLSLRAVAATGEGNRTPVREYPAIPGHVQPLLPADLTRNIWARPLLSSLPVVKDLIRDLADTAKRVKALECLVERADISCYQAVKAVASEDSQGKTKLPAFTALYRADARRARADILELLRAWKNSAAPAPVQGKRIRGEQFVEHWTYGAVLAGHIAKEAGWHEYTPLLVDALKDSLCKDETRCGLLRLLSALADPQSAEAAGPFLSSDNPDVVEWAALAVARSGNKKWIPALRTLMDHEYTPVKVNAIRALGKLASRSDTKAIEQRLTSPDDENLRAAAAAALGDIGNKKSAPALKEALNREPFQWVRDDIVAALDKMKVSTALK